jgi:hypothetical protein
MVGELHIERLSLSGCPAHDLRTVERSASDESAGLDSEPMLLRPTPVHSGQRTFLPMRLSANHAVPNVPSCLAMISR